MTMVQPACKMPAPLVTHEKCGHVHRQGFFFVFVPNLLCRRIATTHQYCWGSVARHKTETFSTDLQDKTRQ